VIKKWEGGGINPNLEADKMVLTGGQVILVLLLMATAFMLWFLALRGVVFHWVFATKKGLNQTKKLLRNLPMLKSDSKELIDGPRSARIGWAV
jgi:hypothetical protein